MNVYGVLCLKSSWYGRDQFKALVWANYQFYGTRRQQEGQSGKKARNVATPIAAYCNPWDKQSYWMGPPCDIYFLLSTFIPNCVHMKIQFYNIWKSNHCNKYIVKLSPRFSKRNTRGLWMPFSLLFSNGKYKSNFAIIAKSNHPFIATHIVTLYPLLSLNVTL